MVTRRIVTVTDTFELDMGSGPLQEKTTTFKMRLHPPHILGSTPAAEGIWFLSDRIRVYGSSHCNPAFQTSVESLLGTCGDKRPLLLVEVGAHLGDCCLWAAARLGRDGVRCLAVELQPQSAAAIMSSISLNGFEDVVHVINAAVGGEEGGCAEEPWGGPDASGVMSAACLLKRWGTADLVSLFTVSADQKIVEALLDNLRLGNIGMVLTRSIAGATPEGIRTFIARHSLSYSAEVFRGGLDTRLVHPDLLDHLLPIRARRLPAAGSDGVRRTRTGDLTYDLGSWTLLAGGLGPKPPNGTGVGACRGTRTRQPA